MKRVTTTLAIDQDNDDKSHDSQLVEWSDSPPPDGGYGWWIVVGVFFANFTACGYAEAWGVLQDYYYTQVFLQQYNLTLFAMIGSLYNMSMLLIGLFLRVPLERVGVRGVIASGAVTMAASFVLAAFAQEPWQLLLTLGVLSGLGAGMVYIPSLGLISQYFTQHAALAMGIASAGTGMGGFALAPMMRLLIDSMGHKWTLGILAGMFLVILSGVVVLSNERVSTVVPVEPKERPQPKGIKGWVSKVFNPRIIRRQDVQAMIGTSFFCAFSVAAPYFFLPSYAISIGCTPIQGALAVGIMSVVNVVGKIILGHLADRFGRINMFLVTTFLTAVSCIAVWPFATTYGWLLVFAVLFGITSGASYSLFMNLSMACGDKEDSPETMSIIFSASIFGDLFGAIIFAALLNASGNAYLPSQAFCAASYGLGTLCILRLRLLKSRKLYDRI